MKNLKPILLIEDDDVDIMTVKRAFGELKITNHLACARDGKEALEYLKNGGGQKPCLILLDLNMPGMSGLGFLKAVKADDILKNIPVVVMTDSSKGQDKIISFESGIAGYIVKPANYGKFVESMKTIDEYWTLSKLPDEVFLNR